jgi:hypothetical protein
MRTVDKLTAAMFPEVYEQLLRIFSPHMPREAFQRAFVPRGWNDEDHFGYVLRVDGQLAGLLGTLFSTRELAGRTYRFCNLHSWFVLPTHRAFSLLLMRPVLTLPDCVLTDFSASAEVMAISERLGFRTLDRTIRMMPPLPWRGRGAEVIDLQADPDLSSRLLSPAQQILFRDHQGIDCEHLLVRDDAGECYIVASRVPSRWLPHVHVHYLSDPRTFARLHATIRSYLFARLGGRYVAINTPHLAGEKLPYSLGADANRRLIRGPEIESSLVDSLYSELPLFKLPIYPRPPLAIRGVALRLWQWQNRWRNATATS